MRWAYEGAYHLNTHTHTQREMLPIAIHTNYVYNDIFNII